MILAILAALDRRDGAAICNVAHALRTDGCAAI
jgi:hypothetical protein